MPGELEIRGVVAQITWSYHVAATVQGYTIRLNKKTGGGTLRATIASADAFKLAQQPLTFVALFGKGVKRWALTLQTFTHGTVTATLAPFQEDPHEHPTAAARNDHP
jgi:hypothetical protein